MKNELTQYKVVNFILAMALIGVFFFYQYRSPTNSLELYSWLLDEENRATIEDSSFLTTSDVTIEDLRENMTKISPHQINQFTFIDASGGKPSLLIETSPGLETFEIIRVIEVTDEVEDFLRSARE